MSRQNISIIGSDIKIDFHVGSPQSFENENCRLAARVKVNGRLKKIYKNNESIFYKISEIIVSPPHTKKSKNKKKEK